MSVLPRQMSAESHLERPCLPVARSVATSSCPAHDIVCISFAHEIRRLAPDTTFFMTHTTPMMRGVTQLMTVTSAAMSVIIALLFHSIATMKVITALLIVILALMLFIIRLTSFMTALMTDTTKVMSIILRML
jgi:hypothetical protein